MTGRNPLRVRTGGTTIRRLAASLAIVASALLLHATIALSAPAPTRELAPVPSSTTALVPVEVPPFP